MSTLNYALIDFQVKRKNNFKCIIEFLDNYQNKPLEFDNFIQNRKLTDKEIQQAFGPACMRISTLEQKEKIFEHNSYYNTKYFTTEELDKKYTEWHRSGALASLGCISSTYLKWWGKTYDVKGYYLDFFDMNLTTSIN